MERGSITTWLLLGVAAILFFTYGLPRLTGAGSSNHPLPFKGLSDVTAPAFATRDAEAMCTIDGSGFRAELSTRGGSLKHFVLKDERWGANGKPMDLVTTTLEGRMPLRTDLRMLGSAGPQQVAYDDFDWKLAASDGKSCTFTYEDPTTSLTKRVAATQGPYELEVTLKVDNLAAEPKKHRLAIEQTAWRTKQSTEGHLGRQSEFLTQTTAITTQKTERHTPSDFEPKAYEKDETRADKDREFTAEKWRKAPPGEARAIAVSSNYFSQILIPTEGPSPSAEAQIEEVWDEARYHADKDRDPSFGHVYRARLAYPEAALPPNGAATYKVLTFIGPKDRTILEKLGHGAPEVLDLGYFHPIARTLIWYLYKLHGVVGGWGWAIVLLTITVRTLLFPLSLTQIKSSMAMRRLKPEMDAINERYKDDATQRGLAIQELWRKNNVTNPVLGCMPMLLQMPVWWALYTSLQTAVELYHTPFAWFADLSAPDRFYIIPVVLGASSFFQQKLMPPQGDPQQQKMMMYMMPAVFTFMMLFLPAGLGVYMLTNTWLGIGQQLLVERYLKAKTSPPAMIEVREKTLGDGGKSTPALGKGKARARG